MIEELRDDPDARRRFLATCGLDGVMLALSHAGGASGRRTLPLLLTDPDWDALGDRIHELLRGLDDEDLADLLGVLAGAVSAAPDPRTTAEAISLASGVLSPIKRQAALAARLMPTFLLAAWFQLDGAIGGRVGPPHLTRTWIERHPGARFPKRLGRSELLRLDDWLELAELLQRHDPGTLEALGFYREDAARLAAAIPALTEAATDSDLHELAEGVLDRIARLLPELTEQTGRAILSGWRAAGQEAERWWVPDDLGAPPTDELVTATPFARRDVRRVLRDL